VFSVLPEIIAIKEAKSDGLGNAGKPYYRLISTAFNFVIVEAAF
jgi:hypothetical protein